MSSLNKNDGFKIGYNDYLRFKELVLERSGLYFPDKKRRDLEAGLLKVLEGVPMEGVPMGGVTDLDSYYNLVSDRANLAGQVELRRLINTLTVDETHFFRDEAQFNALTTHVLPDLILRKRAAAAAIGPNVPPQLRIWSAGCATGEEAYSLAILLKQLLPDIESWNILILATDINQNSLERARRAAYSAWSFREERAKICRLSYFQLEPPNSGRANSYRLRDDIRQMVTFAPLNLIEDDYPALYNNTLSMDLIICRNVTIYFTPEMTQQVIGRFYYALTNQGWLVVGHAEPAPLTYDAFQRRPFPDALLYQKAEQTLPWFKGEAEVIPAAKLPITPNGQAFQEGLSFPVTSVVTPPRKATASFEEAAASDEAVDPYEAAGLLLSLGDIQQAIATLKGKVTAMPHFAPAYSRLGLAYANLGQWTEARRYCQQALELDTLSAEAYYVLGLIHEHEHDLETAINLHKKAVYLERDNPVIHFNLALLYQKSGQITAARRACQNALKILEKMSPAALVPTADGSTAGRLLASVQRIQRQLER